MITAPVLFSADVEQVEADESQTRQAIEDAFDVILEKTSADYGHAVRAVHAKSHGILEGELLVDDGLPPELAQGMFARPGMHRMFMRLSTNAGDILPDVIGLPRGMAMKVLDVEGERLPEAAGTAQDFVMINSPTFNAAKAGKFLGNLKLLAKTTDRIEGTKKAVSAVMQGIHHALDSVGLQSSTVDALGGAPNVEPLGETYHSATAFRYGDYIAKFSLVPVAPALTALTGRAIAIDGRHDAVREEVQREMAGIDAEWEFRVQLCRDLEKQPVEDPTVRWSEDDAPSVRVARVRVRAQDSWDPGRVTEVNETMRFDVWTGLAAHRPLGNINRARRGVYRHSADFRAAFNRCPYHEPSGASTSSLVGDA